MVMFMTYIQGSNSKSNINNELIIKIILPAKNFTGTTPTPPLACYHDDTFLLLDTIDRPFVLKEREGRERKGRERKGGRERGRDRERGREKRGREKRKRKEKEKKEKEKEKKEERKKRKRERERGGGERERGERKRKKKKETEQKKTKKRNKKRKQKIRTPHTIFNMGGCEGGVRERGEEREGREDNFSRVGKCFNFSFR